MGVLRFLARPADSRQGHINNLYNTTFWALVQKGDMGTAEAEEALKVHFAQSLFFEESVLPSYREQ